MSARRNRVKASPWLRATAFLAQNGVRAVRSPRTGLVAGGRPAHRLSAMIRVKNEARFLPEWLAHHVGLGVEHVVVYDNNSDDDVRGAIGPFVDTGLVTLVPWPTVPASPASHLDFLERFGADSEWVAFFDTDEFLVETVPGALATALDRVRDAPALAINWRYFGSAGHDTVPDGLVTDRFDRAAPACNHHVKVIARPTEVVGYRNSHNFWYRRGRLARTAEGRRVFGSFVTPAPEPDLVLNHYVYRSRQDYERKAGHGFVDASGAIEQARRHTRATDEFGRHNDVRVAMDPARLSATATMLRRLGYPERLYAGAPAGGAIGISP